MRRPLAAELSAEERSLARRWVLASASFYSTIVILIIGALLLTSRADKVTVAATSERKDFPQDRSTMRPYGSLPNIAQSILACTTSQSCAALKADGAGRAR
jgi:hypothetical protein